MVGRRQSKCPKEVWVQDLDSPFKQARRFHEFVGTCSAWVATVRSWGCRHRSGSSNAHGRDPECGLVNLPQKVFLLMAEIPAVLTVAYQAFNIGLKNSENMVRVDGLPNGLKTICVIGTGEPCQCAFQLNFGPAQFSSTGNSEGWSPDGAPRFSSRCCMVSAHRRPPARPSR